MRRLAAYRTVGLVVAMLFVVCAGAACAGTDYWIPTTGPGSTGTNSGTDITNILFYNGDPNLAATTIVPQSGPYYSDYAQEHGTYSNEGNQSPAGTRAVFDDFTVPAGQTWNITGLWFNVEDSRHVSMPYFCDAYWQIWQGAPSTTWSSGAFQPSWVAGIFETLPQGSSTSEGATETGYSCLSTSGSTFTNGGWSGVYDWGGLEVPVSVTLGPGTYWLAMEQDVGGQFDACVFPTLGTNSVGAPSSGTGYEVDYYNDTISTFSDNFSYGIAGTMVPTGPIPEPISMIFFGTGLVAVGGYISRRRMQRKA